MKIRNIKIEGLYEKYNFDWTLRDDVNILAGDNGSYKTTLLKIIAAMCEPEPTELDIKGATMSMTEDIIIRYRSFKNSLLRLKKEAENDELLNEIAMKVSSDFKGIDDKFLADHKLNANIIAVKRANTKLIISDFKKERNYNVIATFDVPTQTEKGSVLDQQLNKLESEYAYYLSDLSKQLSDQILQSGQADKEELQKIYAQNNLFIQIVNEAFQNTHKTVDTTQSKLQFKIFDDILENNYKLSSGEKQFLIVMLTILLQREKESILIMDEPEISMHLDWQRNLIKNIRKLNPQCQIILATHSPGVIMDGWEQLVTNISTIKTII